MSPAARRRRRRAEGWGGEYCPSRPGRNRGRDARARPRGRAAARVRDLGGAGRAVEADQHFARVHPWIADSLQSMESDNYLEKDLLIRRGLLRASHPRHPRTRLDADTTAYVRVSDGPRARRGRPARELRAEPTPSARPRTLVLTHVFPDPLRERAVVLSPRDRRDRRRPARARGASPGGRGLRRLLVQDTPSTPPSWAVLPPPGARALRRGHRQRRRRRSATAGHRRGSRAGLRNRGGRGRRALSSPRVRARAGSPRGVSAGGWTTAPPRGCSTDCWAGRSGHRPVSAGSAAGWPAKARALELQVPAPTPSSVPPRRRPGIDWCRSATFPQSLFRVAARAPGPATEGMIGRDELARMKPVKRTLSTSPGWPRDEPAPYALERRHPAGAGLDVLPIEPGRDTIR